MSNQKSFHNYSIAQSEYQLTTKLGLKVLWRRPKRQINYAFANHYHPYVDNLIQELNVNGLAAMLDTKFLQGLQDDLSTSYGTTAPFVTAFPKKEIDVSDDGAYSIYNWELMYHAPMAIATHLSNNQRFAEAQRWFHYIFDPTSNDTTVLA